MPRRGASPNCLEHFLLRGIFFYFFSRSTTGVLQRYCVWFFCSSFDFHWTNMVLIFETSILIQGSPLQMTSYWGLKMCICTVEMINIFTSSFMKAQTRAGPLPFPSLLPFSITFFTYQEIFLQELFLQELFLQELFKHQAQPEISPYCYLGEGCGIHMA